MLSRGSLLASMTLLCACGNSITPDVADAPTYEIVMDDVPDAGPSDRDLDGLCDDTEMGLRTDPDDPDTDHDGYTDGFEVNMYTDPLSAIDPPPDAQMHVQEIAGASASLLFPMAYHGMGETLVAFPLDRGFWSDGRGVAELGLTLTPVSISPRASVGDVTGSTIVQVNGVVFIQWQMSIAWPSIPPLGCRRAYGGFGSIYAQGRGLVWIQSVYLDVRGDPNAASFDAGTSDDGGGPMHPWPYLTQGFCGAPPGNCR